MKKVYVVVNDCTHEYTNVYEIVGIFSTHEKAQHILDNQDEDDLSIIECVVDNPDFLINGKMPFLYTHIVEDISGKVSEKLSMDFSRECVAMAKRDVVYYKNRTLWGGEPIKEVVFYFYAKDRKEAKKIAKERFAEYTKQGIFIDGKHINCKTHEIIDYEKVMNEEVYDE